MKISDLHPQGSHFYSFAIREDKVSFLLFPDFKILESVLIAWTLCQFLNHFLFVCGEVNYQAWPSIAQQPFPSLGSQSSKTGTPTTNTQLQKCFSKRQGGVDLNVDRN